MAVLTIAARGPAGLGACSVRHIEKDECVLRSAESFSHRPSNRPRASAIKSIRCIPILGLVSLFQNRNTEECRAEGVERRVSDTKTTSLTPSQCPRQRWSPRPHRRPRPSPPMLAPKQNSSQSRSHQPCATHLQECPIIPQV